MAILSSLGTHPEVRLLGRGMVLCFEIFEELPDRFPQFLHQFAVPPTAMGVPFSPRPHQLYLSAQKRRLTSAKARNL